MAQCPSGAMSLVNDQIKTVVEGVLMIGIAIGAGGLNSISGPTKVDKINN